MYSTRVSRWVRAKPAEVYRALLDPYAVAAWRVPNGMSATIHEFDAREGGHLRISLYPDLPGGRASGPELPGTFHGRFARLLDGQLVVESLEFESPDPTFAGVMTLTTELREVDDGCEVVMTQEGIPDAVDRATTEVGAQMAMVRLAAWVEDVRRW